jgi:hypothetical protein
METLCIVALQMQPRRLVENTFQHAIPLDQLESGCVMVWNSGILY